MLLNSDEMSEPNSHTMDGKNKKRNVIPQFIVY